MAASGCPGLFMSRRSAVGQWIAALLNIIASCIGGYALIARFWNGEGAQTLSWAWSLPGSQLAVGVDDLSALFLIPMLLISAMGSIYGLEYWKQREHRGNGRKLRLAWGILTAAMMGVVVARDGVALLMAWEIMALAAFFLVATEDRKPEVREAAWVYLVAAHVGTLLLFAFFALLGLVSGSFALWPASMGPIPSWLATALFITGVIGFGLKAGIMPLHVWLPGAHANAPSHVSAILSGVLLKAGVYGIIRVAAILPHPPIWWGGTLLAAGAVTGILGIAFAVAQHDFKRLLAYSSIENVGIIIIGIGLALVGRSWGHASWVVLGLGGALFHVLNHSLFKPLLFMGAGSLLHATGTRQIDLLGGLAKTMPRTFALMLIGAIAICGLPPFNGFASEFLIYLGLFQTVGENAGHSAAWTALAAPALAIIGALAVSAFVKLLGAVFAGSPRTTLAEHGHDPHAMMLIPMFVLGTCCVVIGIAPILLAHVIERAVAVWDPSAALALSELVPLKSISAVGVGLVIAILTGGYALKALRARRPSASAGTWDCGYIRPTARIQYTGSSFGQMLVDLFRWALAPRKTAVALLALFPGRSGFKTQVPDTVLDRGVLPALSLSQRILSWARPIQGGPVQAYLLYILLTLLALLLIARW
jgi:hydrogenase-4 component B